MNSKWCNPHPAASSVTYLPFYLARLYCPNLPNIERSLMVSDIMRTRVVAGLRGFARFFPIVLLLASPATLRASFVLFCFVFFFFLTLVLLRGAWTFGSRGCYTRLQTWLEATEHVLSTLPVSLARLCVWGSLLSTTPETPKGCNLQHTYTCVCVCGVCREMPTWVETFENPQRQVDLDLWFLAGSDFSYFLFLFFGSIFLRGRPLSRLFYFLLLSHSLSFHSLETKEEELEKRSRLARAAMGASPDQRAPLSLTLTLSMCLCVLFPICAWRIVSTEGWSARLFLTRKDTLHPCLLLFFCDVSNHHDGRTKQSLPIHPAPARKYIYNTVHTQDRHQPSFLSLLFFCLS